MSRPSSPGIRCASAQPPVAGVPEREEVLGSAAWPRHQVGPPERHARRRERGGDSGLTVRPVRHLHVAPPAGNAAGRTASRHRCRAPRARTGARRWRGRPGRSRPARRTGAPRAHRAARSRYPGSRRCSAPRARHGAAPTRSAASRQGSPARSSRAMARSAPGRVQGDEGPDRADQPVEVVVLGGVGDPAYQRRGDLVAQRPLAGRQVASEPDLRQHVRQSADAGVHAVGVLAGLVCARVLREPHVACRRDVPGRAPTPKRTRPASGRSRVRPPDDGATAWQAAAHDRSRPAAAGHPRPRHVRPDLSRARPGDAAAESGGSPCRDRRGLRGSDDRAGLQRGGRVPARSVASAGAGRGLRRGARLR